VSEPFNLTGATHNFIDAQWVCTHAPTPGAVTSNAIVSVASEKGRRKPQIGRLRSGRGRARVLTVMRSGGSMSRRLLRRRMMTIQTRGRMRGIGVGMGAREAHRGYAN